MSKHAPKGMTFLHILANGKSNDMLTICRSNEIKIDPSIAANKLGLRGKWVSKFKLGPIGIQFANAILADMSRGLSEHQLVAGKRVYNVSLRKIKRLMSDAEMNILEQFKGSKKKLEDIDFWVKVKSAKCEQLDKDIAKLEAYRNKLEATLAKKKTELDSLQTEIDEIQEQNHELFENRYRFEGMIKGCRHIIEDVLDLLDSSTDRERLEDLLEEIVCLNEL